MKAPLTSPEVPADAVADADGAPAVERLLAWLDRRRGWVLAGVVLFYLAGFNAQWRVTTDLSLHLVIARNIVEGEGFVHPLSRHLELNPGLAYLVAGTWKVFGADVLWPVHVVMFLGALGALGLVYSLVKLHFDRPRAVAVTVLVAVTERFYRYAFDVLTDLPFLLGVLVFLVGYERVCQRRGSRWISAVAMVGGLALMAAFRTVVVTFVAAVVLAVAWHVFRGRRRWWWVATAAFVALLSAGALVLVDPGALSTDLRVVRNVVLELPASLERMALVNFPRLLEETGPDAFFGAELAPGVDAVLSLIVLALGVLLVRRRPLWGMLVGVFVLQITLFFFVIPRYLLPILPLAVIGWWVGAEWVARRGGPRHGPVLFGCMIGLWAVPNLARDVNLIVEQRRVPFLEEYRRGQYARMVELAGQLEARTPADAVIFVDPEENADVLMYFSRRLVVSPEYAGWWAGGMKLIPQALAGTGDVYVLNPESPGLRPFLEQYGAGAQGPGVEMQVGEKAHALYRLVPEQVP